MKKLDWDKIREKFDAWYHRREKSCKECGRWGSPPDWEDQWAHIKRLVNAELKRCASS